MRLCRIMVRVIESEICRRMVECVRECKFARAALRVMS